MSPSVNMSMAPFSSGKITETSKGGIVSDKRVHTNDIFIIYLEVLTKLLSS